MTAPSGPTPDGAAQGDDFHGMSREASAMSGGGAATPGSALMPAQHSWHAVESPAVHPARPLDGPDDNTADTEDDVLTATHDDGHSHNDSHPHDGAYDADDDVLPLDGASATPCGVPLQASSQCRERLPSGERWDQPVADMLSAAEACELLRRWTRGDAPAGVTATTTGCHHTDVLTLRTPPGLALDAFVRRAFQYAACPDTCFTVALAYIRRLTTDAAPTHYTAACAAATAAYLQAQQRGIVATSDEAVPSLEPASHDSEAASSHPADSSFAPDTSSPFAPAHPACVRSGRVLELTPYNVHRVFAAALTVAIKATQDVYHPMGYYGAVFGVTAVDLRRMEVAVMVLLDHRLYVGARDVAALRALLLA